MHTSNVASPSLRGRGPLAGQLQYIELPPPGANNPAVFPVISRLCLIHLIKCTCENTGIVAQSVLLNITRVGIALAFHSQTGPLTAALVGNCTMGIGMVAMGPTNGFLCSPLPNVPYTAPIQATLLTTLNANFTLTNVGMVIEYLS